MSSKPHYEPRVLQVLRALTRGPQSYRSLAATLCISPEYAKQLVRRLGRTGHEVRSARQGSQRVYRVAAPLGGLTSLLSNVEQEALSQLWQGPPSPLQSAIYKLSHHLLAA